MTRLLNSMRYRARGCCVLRILERGVVEVVHARSYTNHQKVPFGYRQEENPWVAADPDVHPRAQEMLQSGYA